MDFGILDLDTYQRRGTFLKWKSYNEVTSKDINAKKQDPKLKIVNYY